MTDKTTQSDFEIIQQRFRDATEQNLELIHELMTSNDELAQMLHDIHTLCDQQEFKRTYSSTSSGKATKKTVHAVPSRLSPKGIRQKPLTAQVRPRTNSSFLAKS